jgi:hypothetical protein
LPQTTSALAANSCLIIPDTSNLTAHHQKQEHHPIMTGGGTEAKTSKMGSFSKIIAKPRVGVILRQAVPGGKKPTHTPSEQVETLQNKYKDMCQNLKRLLKVLKERHAAMLETVQARDAVR